MYISLFHMTSEAINPLCLFKSLVCQHKVSCTLIVLLASLLHLHASRMIVSTFSDTHSIRKSGKYFFFTFFYFSLLFFYFFFFNVIKFFYKFKEFKKKK